MAKTHDNKEDFIHILSMMDQNEINDYIKRHGKRPKKTVLATLVKKPDQNKK